MTGYRTLSFAFLMAGLGVVQTFNWAQIIPQNETWSGVAMIGVGAAIAFLRTITTTPVATPPAATK